MNTDSQRQQDVIAEPAWEPAVQASRIGAKVVDGVTIPAGTLRSGSERGLAVRPVRSSAGARSAVNQMNLVY